MEPVIFTLPNGIRVIHKQEKTHVGHLAVLVDAGSRDEEEHQHGLAHLIEHVIFKGTKKRKAFHVLSRIDAVGGEINAYTSKEETCIYASFLNIYFERAFELFADILSNSEFPEREIKKEKQVIADEIASYDDNPAESIFDRFEEEMFPNHPLGRSILGTPESLASLKRSDIFEFISNHYLPSRIVIATVGKNHAEEIKSLALKYFSDYSAHKGSAVRKKAGRAKKFFKAVDKPIHQAHCIIGNRAYGQHDRRRFSMSLLNNLLGGPAMNSRLNLAIREKYGFTYNLESNYQMFTETGIFSVYLGTDPKFLDRTKELVYKELAKLRDNELGTKQLAAAKQQLIGQIALAQESRMSLAIAMAKSMVVHNKMDTLETLYARINSITTSEIKEVADEVFNPDKMSELIYKPI